ncbi:hypothetical protein [Streptacidiphilus cavernicola]|uniref:Uncharacterized protein n=1 Tax=Streptacidiphilus cavernicola TaxID=3342716 RepID=A0ABV6VY69_9ACTN
MDAVLDLRPHLDYDAWAEVTGQVSRARASHLRESHPGRAALIGLPAPGPLLRSVGLPRDGSGN